MKRNRQRVIDLLNTKGFEADEQAIKAHLEKLLKVSTDGKIEFLDSLARLARLASLARLARLDSLDSLDIYYEIALSYSDDKEISERWSPFLDACESGMYQAFFVEGKIYVLKVPNQVFRDNQGRLHSDNQPAVIWLGEKIYFWHGIEISERAIVDINSYSAKEILSERNTEVRRALMSLYGYERILPEVKAKLIDQNPDPTIGKLYEFSIDGQKHHVAMVQDGTPMYFEKGKAVYRQYTIATRTSLNDIVSSLKDTYPMYRHLTNDQYLSIPRT